MNEKRLIVIYCRVSSTGQDFKLQHSTAERYLESINLTIKEDFVKVLNDHNISATKKKINERPSLVELINLIKLGKVKTVIIYKRDRLARNFYEFVRITRIFINYNVEVIYTGSNEPPFKNMVYIESLYGILGQMEGKNIAARTNEARKQYPGQILGYNHIKNHNQKSQYLIDANKKKLITSLFNEIKGIDTAEDFIKFLLTKRDGLSNPRKMVSILSNPFYAAHYETKGNYLHLHNVEPMISLDTFLKTQEKLKKFMDTYHSKSQCVSNLFIIHPICGLCGKKMKIRNHNDLNAGYFVCRKNHNRIAIPVETFYKQITKTVFDYFQTISANRAKRIIMEKISSEHKTLERKKYRIDDEYIRLCDTIVTMDYKHHKRLQQYLNQAKELQGKIDKINRYLIELEELKGETKYLTDLAKSPLNMTQQQLHHLITILIEHAQIYDSYIQVNLYLSTFAKETAI